MSGQGHSITYPIENLKDGDTILAVPETLSELARAGVLFTVEQYTDDGYCHVGIQSLSPNDFEPLICADCGREFGPDQYDDREHAGKALGGHMRSIDHQKNGSKVYTCDDCGEEFSVEEYGSVRSAAAGLAGHSKEHSSEKSEDADDDDEATGLKALFDDDAVSDEGEVANGE